MKQSQLWHDFVLGMHYRAIHSIDDEEWSSWGEAGKTFYGEKYTAIYDRYNDMLMEGEIDE